VRYENVIVDVTDPDKVVYDYKKVVTVLNSKHVGLLTFQHYYEKGDKLKKLRIEFLDAKGETIKKVAKSDIQDYAATSGGWRPACNKL